ncbi:hypothetical protein ABPG74_014735 [Tetrahymena malaccensis]
MDYMNSYYYMEQEQPHFDYFLEEQEQEQQNHSPLGVQKKICKKKYQKALKWAHIASPFSENQTPEKFLLYGNINLFTNYSEDTSKCPYTSECLVENGYYKLDQVQVTDKKGVEMQVSTLKPCLDKFQFLINLYKRYQSSKYCELANVLLQYQKFIKQEFDRSNCMYKQLKKDANLQSKLQEEFNAFQLKTIAEIHTSNSSSITSQYYSYRTATTNYKTGQPEIKKYGTSESLVNLLGVSVQNEQQNLLWKMRKQQAFSKNQENHLFRSQESISKAIFMIKNVVGQESAYSFSQTLLTRDGFEIPCTVKVQVISNQTLNYIKHYESRDQQVLLYTYIFNKSDIQTLQNKRENMSSQNSSISTQQISLNLNLGIESYDDSQGSNFVLEHTSETFSDIDLNNYSPQQQYQQCQQTKCYQNTFPNKTLNQSFSPLSTVTCSIQQYNRKLEQKNSCDYSRKSQIFINKYYKHLLTKNTQNTQSSQ